MGENGEEGERWGQGRGRRQGRGKGGAGEGGERRGGGEESMKHMALSYKHFLDLQTLTGQSH